MTVVCQVRHGHGTSAACIDRLYSSTRIPFRFLYVDVASPPALRPALDAMVAKRPHATVFRVDEFVSRQTARLRAFERVETPYVVFLDNNMICSPGCLDILFETMLETDATVVSPLIITQGGEIHFSGGYVKRRPDPKRLRLWAIKCPHHQPGAPVGTPIEAARLRRVPVDFVESHCCLMRTEWLRRPGVLEESLHNAHTMCWAGYKLAHEYGQQVILEPTAIAAILPLGFGYDMPWMMRSYMRPDWIKISHDRLRELLGVGPGTDLGPGLRWHQKHFKYLALSMLDRGRDEREDLLGAGEVPDSLISYDQPLPDEADRRMREQFVPFVERRYPELLALTEYWLARDIAAAKAGGYPLTAS